MVYTKTDKKTLIKVNSRADNGNKNSKVKRLKYYSFLYLIIIKDKPKDFPKYFP